MTAALDYIIKAIATLVLFIILLRFWMPWFRVDFRNAIAQGILRVTGPLVIPLRRVLPPIGRVDTATVVVAFAIQYLTIVLRLFLVNFSLTDNYGAIAIMSVASLAVLTANLFMLVIFVHILLGWFAPGVYNPATALVSSIAEPLLRPFRRLVPSMGGFDISPIIPLILLGAFTRLVTSYIPVM